MINGLSHLQSTLGPQEEKLLPDRLREEAQEGLNQDPQFTLLNATTVRGKEKRCRKSLSVSISITLKMTVLGNHTTEQI